MTLTELLDQETQNISDCMPPYELQSRLRLLEGVIDKLIQFMQLDVSAENTANGRELVISIPVDISRQGSRHYQE